MANKLRPHERGSVGEFRARIDKHGRKPGGPREGVRLAGSPRVSFGGPKPPLNLHRNPGLGCTKATLAREARASINAVQQHPDDVIASARVLCNIKRRVLGLTDDQFRARRPMLMAQCITEVMRNRRKAC